MKPQPGEFSVYQYFADDAGHERVASFIDAQSAVQLAAQLASSVGGRIGTTQRIIITDGFDFIAFEWLYGQGVVYPVKVPEEKSHE